MRLKHIIIAVLFCLLVLPAVAQTQQKTVPEKTMKTIYDFIKQKEYPKALQVTENAMKAYGRTDTLLQMKYNLLMKMEKYTEALAYIDNLVKKTGPKQEYLAAKYNILMTQKNYVEALKVAKKKYDLSSKSPWECMNLVHTHLDMGNLEEAMDWMQEAVSRGFISYRILQGKRYEKLHKQKRFYEIIETIKIAIGLGKPAQTFTVRLTSGKDFNLAEQKGKVVLIDFWATWCGPCKEHLPFLKKIYEQYKDKGLVILGINLDTNEKIFRDYLSIKKMDWALRYSGQGWNDAIVRRYSVDSLPSRWLIDKQGTLRSFGLQGKELAQAIATLLAEK